MDQVEAGLWIGDAADARNVEALRAAGVGAVFNATPEPDNANWPADFAATTSYLQLNQDDCAPIPPAKIDQFVGFMETHHREGVLIHCAAGVSRASTFTILWLMITHGASWDDAEALVRKARPFISPHPTLKASVMAWWGTR